MNRKHQILLAVVLIGALAGTRFFPGELPQNFSAVYALAFCGGAFLPRRLAWIIPLLALFLTDLLLNAFFYDRPLVNGFMATNYLAIIGIVALGRWVGNRASWWNYLGGGLLAALLFYLVTNTAAWLMNPYYAKTVAGWIQALTLGEPGWPPTWEFFRNTLLSGGLFSGLFAGAMKLAEAREPAEETEEEETEVGEPEEAQA